MLIWEEKGALPEDQCTACSPRTKRLMARSDQQISLCWQRNIVQFYLVKADNYRQESGVIRKHWRFNTFICQICKQVNLWIQEEQKSYWLTHFSSLHPALYFVAEQVKWLKVSRQVLPQLSNTDIYAYLHLNWGPQIHRKCAKLNIEKLIVLKDKYV